MRVQSVISGLISHLPGGNDFLDSRNRKRRTGRGTQSPTYCYAVWLRHLDAMHAQLGAEFCPQTVAEIGPGLSLGAGMSALLSGANKYCGLEVVNRTDVDKNRQIFEQLVEMFREQRNVPSHDEIPEIFTGDNELGFPVEILSLKRMEKFLEAYRLDKIRSDIANLDKESTDNAMLSYVVPWSDPEVLPEDSLDHIFSMSVLEHVDELADLYRLMYRWLRVGGTMSHEVDFRSHGLATRWNGHWSYSKPAWSVIRGKRPFLINRLPYSEHLRLLSECGFEVMLAQARSRTDGIGRSQLAREFTELTEADLHTFNATFIARKT